MFLPHRRRTGAPLSSTSVPRVVVGVTQIASMGCLSTEDPPETTLPYAAELARAEGTMRAGRAQRHTAPLHSTAFDVRKHCQEGTGGGVSFVDGGAKWSMVEHQGGQWGRRRVDVGEVADLCFSGRTRPGSTRRAGCSCPPSTASAWRAGLVVTRGQERCLFIYPMDEFVKVAEQMHQAPMTSQGARDYMPRLPRPARPTRSPTGRAASPSRPTLRQYAGLDREVTVIGAGSRLEVWDSAAWNAYLEATRAELRRDRARR